MGCRLGGLEAGRPEWGTSPMERVAGCDIDCIPSVVFQGAGFPEVAQDADWHELVTVEEVSGVSGQVAGRADDEDLVSDLEDAVVLHAVVACCKEFHG